MGSQTPSTTQTNSVKYSPEQQSVIDSAMPFISQYASSALPTLPSNLIAGFNPNEVAAQNSAVQTATGTGAQLGQNAAASNSFLLDPAILNPSSNPYLAQHGQDIATTMNQSLLEQVLPALRSQATQSSGPYAGGQSKAGIAEGLASGRNSQAIGNSLTDLYNRSYTTGLNTMLQAGQQVPLTQQSLLFGSNVQGQVGAQQRALEQAQLDSTNQMALLQQQLPFLRAQDLLSLVQGMPGAQGVSTVTGSTPSVSPVQGALGGALAGSAFGPWGTALGGGAGLLSSIFN